MPMATPAGYRSGYLSGIIWILHLEEDALIVIIAVEQ